MPLKLARTLADDPDLAQFLDRTRHPDLDPATIARHCGRKLWWRCPAGPDHAWQCRPGKHAPGLVCPFCNHRRVSITNCLATAAPELAVEWHPRKNGSLTPYDVMPGSDTMVFWQCAMSVHHVWRARVAWRKAGHGCPFCAGRRVGVDNCLSAVAPDLAREWHPTKNGDLTPDDVTRGTRRRVFWCCSKHSSHVWQSSVFTRAVQGAGCPFCAGLRPSSGWNLAGIHPAVAAEWHPTRNGRLGPRDVTPGSDRKVWWQCPRDPRHVWRVSVGSRTGHLSGCPRCRLPPRGRSLGVRIPALAALWHPTKNGALTPFDVPLVKKRSFWWKCPNGPDHEWNASLRGDRPMPVAGYCPFCRGRRVSITNSLAVLEPAIAAEWHPTRNGALTPAQVTSITSRAVWWRCPAGHVYKATVRHRTHERSGCPACYLRKRRPATKRKGGSARLRSARRRNTHDAPSGT